jgi:hypothetical protein
VSEEGRVYAVCDRCGHFAGDLRLYPGQEASCDQCGADRLWAFADRAKALQHSRDIKGRLAE